jgi:2-methylcitrate dehydratase PrpD
MESVAPRLARWIDALDAKAIPSDVIERAKACVLDQLGCQITGATMAHTRPVLEHVQELGARPESSIAGGGGKTTPIYAAYVNGTFGHSFEYDDGHVLMGHPGAVVIPATLAYAERDRRSGIDLLVAIVAGYQAMALGGAAVHKSARHRGWHPMKMQGPFGAAGGVAKLLGLNQGQIVNALAIAGSEASGPMEYDQSGGEVKRLHAGSASRSGAQAAALAARGLTGPSTIFEGKRGIFALFGDGFDADPESFWQRDFHLRDTMFKLSPAVFTIHGAIQAALAIRDKHKIRHQDIAAIHADVAEITILHGAGIVHPDDMIGAQFSLQFSMGLSFVRGHNLLSDYKDPLALADPEIAAIADKVAVRCVDVAPGASELGGRITVELKDGTSLSEDRPIPRGHYMNPAGFEDILAKFRALVADVIPDSRAQEIVDIVGALDTLDDCARLAALIGMPGRAI